MASKIIPFYNKSSYYEIACMLFENCNLKCKFCFEPHINKKIDINYIINLPNIIFENFSKVYQKQPWIKDLHIMLWGGELFYDTLPEEVFNSYYQFIDKVKNIFIINFPNINVNFSWLTNGVFTNKERVEKLLKYSNGIINFSYDPVYRFNTKKQLDMMIDNAKYFKNTYGDKISIVLTKESIKKFLNGESELILFNNMGYNIDVNYYIPNLGWKEFLPSDIEIYNFLKWALDNRLFNIKIIEKLLNYYTEESVSHYCNCIHCAQITYGEWTTNCVQRSSGLLPNLFYQDRNDEITEQNSNQIKATMGLLKRGCLTCEYYNKCQKPCWVAIIFKGTNIDNCYYKLAYKYIENNPKILYDFNKWRNINDRTR